MNHDIWHRLELVTHELHTGPTPSDLDVLHRGRSGREVDGIGHVEGIDHADFAGGSGLGGEELEQLLFVTSVNHGFKGMCI